MLNKNSLEIKLTYEEYKKQVIDDYKVIFQSREASLLGRREVLSGKAKFGIFGDGKELPQVVLSKFFKNGDFRAGYYRDQTILFSQEKLTLNNFFSALYANTDLKMEPMSGGRQMGGHFVTPSNDQNGDFYDLVNQKNHSSDISPVAGQITQIDSLEKGGYTVAIKTASGDTVSADIPKGLELAVSTGKVVSADTPLSLNPNVGGFGQTETEIVLQSPERIYGYMALCFFITLTQIFLVIKKKQFEKVQAAEMNF